MTTTATMLRTLIATALLIATTAPAGAWTPPNLSPAETEALTEPLSPNDPNAMLDPSLLDVPQATPPAPGAYRPSRRRGRAVVQDVETGRVRRARPSTERSATPESFVGNAIVTGEPTGEREDERATYDRTIFGSDERQQVTGTSAHPWRMMTKIYMTFSNGQRFMCSGVMVGPNDVLTAAHCLINPAAGRLTRVEVIPGMSGTYRPYGSAFGRRWTWSTGFSNSPDHDWLVLNLDRNIGSVVGWMGIAVRGDSSLRGILHNTAGYPGDRANGMLMYRTSGSVDQVTANALLFRFDIRGGQSGSPIYQYNASTGSRLVVGIVTHENPSWNFGCRVTSSKFQMMISARDSG